MILHGNNHHNNFDPVNCQHPLYPLTVVTIPTVKATSYHHCFDLIFTTVVMQRDYKYNYYHYQKLQYKYNHHKKKCHYQSSIDIPQPLFCNSVTTIVSA